MSFVHFLDDDTINKIAAGEVVERPASVIKELVENAIDAHADHIEVEIASGGTSFMRVSDNGIGMSRQDAELAILRHATSKIVKVDDLQSIATLGFRGEALPSIASVSRFSLMTRQAGDELGTVIKISGGRQPEIEETGCSLGTTIRVEDLFFNTPARKKFLKTTHTEGSKINEFIIKLAISKPQIAFKLINNNKTAVATPGSGDLKETLQSIYGGTVGSALLPLEFEDEDIRLSGFVSKPSAIRSSRSWQTFIVNGRIISGRAITKAVDNAYHALIPKTGYPLVVLNIQVPQNTIDVNVHPQKSEMKFEDEGRVFKAVYKAVLDAIRPREQERQLGSVAAEVDEAEADRYAAQGRQAMLENLPEQPASLPQQPQRHWQAMLENLPDVPEALKAAEAGAVSGIMAGKRPAAYVPVYGERRQEAMQWREKPYTSIVKATDAVENIEGIEKIEVPEGIQAGGSAYVHGSGRGSSSSCVNYADDMGIAADMAYTAANGSAGASINNNNNVNDNANANVADDVVNVVDTDAAAVVADGAYAYAGRAAAGGMVPIGQVDNTYIIAQDADGLYIIDQHAAHERILFDRFSARAGEIPVQQLLVHIVLDFSRHEAELVEQNRTMLSELGFGLEPCGPNQFRLMEVPADVPSGEAEDFIREILAALEELHKPSAAELRKAAIATASCRAAVKAGFKLNFRQMEILLEELNATAMPYTCPHGRPTIIRFSSDELAKMFKRTGF